MTTPSKVWYLERFNMMEKLRKEDMLHMQQSMVMKRVDKDTLRFLSRRKK